jgi:hypothetical protein
VTDAQANNAIRSGKVGSLVWRLLRDFLLIVACGVAVVAAISLLMTGLGSDAPFGFVFMVFGFFYACVMPGLLIPYAIMIIRSREPSARSPILPVIAGTAYPALMATVQFVSVVVFGPSVAMADRLVESVPGWIVMVVVLLTTGALLSLTAAKICRRITPGPSIDRAPEPRDRR